MNVSEKGLRFLEAWEGKRNTWYPDSGGAPTIGIGHLLTMEERRSGKIRIVGANPHNSVSVRYADGLDDNQVYDLLRYDLVRSESAIKIGVKVELNQDQYDALVSFTFNNGVGAFINSTLLKLLNKREYTSVPTQMKRWIHDNGKIVQGLVNRRADEIKLWNGVWTKREDGPSSTR